MTRQSYGEIAYKAFKDHFESRSCHVLAPWEHLSWVEREAWCLAANSVAIAYHGDRFSLPAKRKGRK
jgi:hypothetical protein